MSEALAFDLDIEHIITEDDEPVDNIASEKQQRLLTEPLYSYPYQPPDSDGFIAAANVGVFYATHQPPLVPDVFLSLDVQVADNWWEKKHRSYFVWEFGKPPDVVIEIVSNRKGNELSRKLRDYAKIGVRYYAVFDPSHQISTEILQVFQLQGRFYTIQDAVWLEQVGLGLTLWSGTYEGKNDEWLRWCDRDQRVIPTGAEKAALAEKQAAAAEKQAAAAEKQAEALSAELARERERSQQLTDRLRAMGIDAANL